MLVDDGGRMKYGKKKVRLMMREEVEELCEENFESDGRCISCDFFSTISSDHFQTAATASSTRSKKTETN